MTTFIRLIFLAAAVAALLLAVKFFRDGKNSEAWPSARGELQVAKVIGDGTPTMGARGHPSDVYFVRYSYSVAGKQFTGDRVTLLDMPFAHYTQPDPALPRPGQSNLNVFYKADDPAESVLVPGPPYTSILTLLSISALSLIFFFYWKRVADFFVSWLVFTTDDISES